MYKLPRTLIIALTLPLLSLSACDKDKKEEKTEDKQPEPPKVEKKDPATLFDDASVTLPAPYGALKIGMTKDEAKAAMASLPEDGTIKTEEYPDIWFNTDFDDDTTKLNRVYFNMPKADAVKFATAKWGEPQKGTDLGKEVLWWFNPEAKLRASLGDSFTDGEATIEFTSYMPAKELLGEGKEIAFEKDAPLLGMTAADVEAKYAIYIKKMTEEQAKKQQEEISKMAGQDVGAVLGKPTASTDLDLPPTEWGKYWTRVNFSWSDEGKVERFWFGIDFEPHPEAKDEIFALLKAKWGDPKEEEKYGDKLFIFSEDPRIEVKEDTISNKWDITVEPAKAK